MNGGLLVGANRLSCLPLDPIRNGIFPEKPSVGLDAVRILPAHETDYWWRRLSLCSEWPLASSQLSRDRMLPRAKAILESAAP